MRIFLTGIACVGKTTVGMELASLLGRVFYDLDAEIEKFYGKPIARFQASFLTAHTYRHKAAAVLSKLLELTHSQPCVIALTPAGLMGPYWRALKKGWGPVVVLSDTPSNILSRIAFYDDDSHRIDKALTISDKKLYLREIKKDMTYFRRSYLRADFMVDIAGLGPAESALKVAETLGVAPICSPSRNAR